MFHPQRQNLHENNWKAPELRLQYIHRIYACLTYTCILSLLTWLMKFTYLSSWTFSLEVERAVLYACWWNNKITKMWSFLKTRPETEQQFCNLTIEYGFRIYALWLQLVSYYIPISFIHDFLRLKCKIVCPADVTWLRRENSGKLLREIIL